MSSDPSTQQSKAQSLSPQDLVVKELQQLQRARERIAALEQARWGLFTPREVQLIQKALNDLLLELSTGNSLDALTETGFLLESLQRHIEYRWIPPDSGSKPDPN